MHRKTTFTMKLERWLLIEFFFNLWVQLNRSKYDSMMTRRMHSAMPAYLLLFESLPRASREITWPQINLIGGFTSVLCCRRIGQANIEWYLYSLPKSISTYNHHQHHHHHQFFIHLYVITPSIQLNTWKGRSLLFYDADLNTGACTLIQNYFLIHTITKLDSIIMTSVYAQLFYACNTLKIW